MAVTIQFKVIARAAEVDPATNTVRSHVSLRPVDAATAGSAIEMFATGEALMAMVTANQQIPVTFG